MHFWWSANLYALTHVQTIVQRYSIQIKKAKFYLRAGCKGGGWGMGFGVSPGFEVAEHHR